RVGAKCAGVFPVESDGGPDGLCLGRQSAVQSWAARLRAKHRCQSGSAWQWVRLQIVSPPIAARLVPNAAPGRAFQQKVGSADAGWSGVRVSALANGTRPAQAPALPR